MDCSLGGSSTHGIFQAGVLEWGATAFSEMLYVSHVQFFVTPWTAACQAPLSLGFPRQEYWSGLPCPPPEDLPNPEIEPASLALAGKFFTTRATRLRKETSNRKVLRTGDSQGGGRVKLPSSCTLCPSHPLYKKFRQNLSANHANAVPSSPVQSTYNKRVRLPWRLGGREPFGQCRRHGFHSWVGKIL